MARHDDGKRIEFVLDEYTLRQIVYICKELGIGTRKDAVKLAIYELSKRIRSGEFEDGSKL